MSVPLADMVTRQLSTVVWKKKKKKKSIVDCPLEGVACLWQRIFFLFQSLQARQQPLQLYQFIRHAFDVHFGCRGPASLYSQGTNDLASCDIYSHCPLTLMLCCWLFFRKSPHKARLQSRLTLLASHLTTSSHDTASPWRSVTTSFWPNCPQSPCKPILEEKSLST